MNTYLALFMIGTCSSLVMTPVVRRISERYGWLDVPRDARRVHRKPVPRVGGVAVFGAIIIALATLPFIDNLVTQSLGRSELQLLVVLAPAAIMFLFGVYDDLRGAGARLKFIVQVLAGALLYVLGGRIEGISVPFAGSVGLPWPLSFAVTVFWTVAVTNAFNLIDGVDGLAAGASLFASVVILIVSLMLGHPLVSVVAVALCGALVGFLRYNFNPASIFLGDSGSLFVGFTLAALSVQGTQKASTAVAIAIPLMAFGLPIIDTGFTMIRRFIGGRPLFEGDREHIHHMLLARGWSQRRVAFVLYGVCALFALVALLFINNTGRMTGLVLFITGAAVVLAMGRLRYHEVDELGAGMKRNISERRLRVANNIRVRRASRAMSQATTLSELFEAVREMLELSEFVYATVQLGRGGDAALNEGALARERGARSLRGAEVRGGLICWSWERGDIEASEIAESSNFWTLRLPLSTKRAGWGYMSLYRELESDALLLDINYLCDLFQREMARAAERVLSAVKQEPETKVLVLRAASGK